jgi:hypothetical protein
MAVSNFPAFAQTPRVSGGKLLTANTARDGTGANAVVIYMAGQNGARIDKIKVQPKGSNVATVLRLFANNGSDSSVGSNNFLVFEKTLPLSTAAENAEITGYDLWDTGGQVKTPPIPHLPAGGKLIATIGTTVASGIDITVFGGDL